MNFELAIAIAAGAHAGQEDKQGETYLLHVMRVALAVPPGARVVAALHDVVEDRKSTFGDLEARGLRDPELAALKLLTRGKEPYEEYIEGVATTAGVPGELARQVKRADLEDNLGRLTPKLEGKRARYEKALERLASLP